MFRNKIILCAYLWATIFTATLILGQQQQQFFRKPWPTYSLQNMPQTQFTCHDKILGGYYADAETQCQMFHVCVKVAGVGVQDFRFLCPNGTAFEQEAQICADWGDVDCEQSVLYYGSDNFDLYRIGSGFESKRAPLAEEEEATFHLQRAESADVRRSKETRVDQKSRPEQPPNYTKHYEAATTRNFYANHNYGNLNANEKLPPPPPQLRPQKTKQTKNNEAVKKPIANFYTPTTSTTTTTTTTTTERSNSIDESRQDFDDIFKGSHSSHFFSNRNGGREDETFDYNGRSKQNDFVDFSKKAETSTSKTRLQTVRPRRVQSSSTATTGHTTSTKSFTTLAPTTKKLTLHTSYQADSLSALNKHQQKVTTTPTTTSTTTTRSASNAQRFNLQQDFYHTQEKIQPTTYNPGHNIYRLKTTPTPKYNEVNTKQEKSKAYNKPTASARKIQKLERTQAQQQKLGPRNSTFVNNNEFTEFAKVKTEQPKPFQPVQTFRAPPPPPPAKPTHNVEPQYFRSRAQQVSQSRVGTQDPAPFSAPITTQKPIQTRGKTTTTPTPELSPRGFTNRGSINYKASTQREALEYFSPTTTQAVKKFSTIVPKELYTPTTFKPSTHKSSDYNFYLTQQTVRPANNKPQRQQGTTTTTTTTAAPATANTYYNPDEDDGQYHPELYESDFPRNRLNLQRSSSTTKLTTTTVTTTTRRPYAHNHRFDTPQTHLKTQQQSAFQKQQEQSVSSSELSDEDELFKTAHSLNFGAASINKLRADIIKAEKTSQQYNSQYSPNLVQQSSSPKVTAPAPHTTPTSTTYYTFPSTHSTSTTQLYSPSVSTTTTTTTTTAKSTKRPFTYLPNTTLVPKSFEKPSKPSKSTKRGKGKGKKVGTKTASSKRPPHADEDTSYDYAYYDSDTLSESPQEYPEYEIAEFAKTRKN